MPLLVALLVVDENMTKTENLTPELHEATDGLIQNLLASEPFLAYQKSRVQYKSDAQAHALIERLSALQAEVRRKQATSSVTQADIEELRTVQVEVQANETLIMYSNTQQGAVNFLREINQEISQLLGVDFASLSKQSSCC